MKGLNPFRYLLAVLTVICFSGLPVFTQKKDNRTRPAHVLKKRFEVGKQIDLRLKQCVTTINLADIGFNASSIDVEGENITLRNDKGESVAGEVRSYARSAYWLDANIGLIFGRTKTPSTDPNWKPPVVISLVLLQDRQSPRRFTVTPAVGLNQRVAPARISCATAEAKQ